MHAILKCDHTYGAQLSSSYRIKIFAYKAIVHHWFFGQTCIGLHKMDQKLVNIGFQSQIPKSNIDSIHLKIIFHLEYWIRRTFYLNGLIWYIHFWKTLFTKKGSLFVWTHMQSKITLFKILLVDINFLGKNEHSLGWAHLCSISVVILT